jgi:hypothetical protein
VDFPIRITKMYFCDINLQSTNFIQIQECLDYADGVGPGSLFPANDKFQDWKIPNEHVELMYPLLIKALAVQCAWYENSRASPAGLRIREVFPVANVLARFPRKGHWLLRWLCYWGGKAPARVPCPSQYRIGVHSAKHEPLHLRALALQRRHSARASSLAYFKAPCLG